MEDNVRIDKGIPRGPKGMQPAELPKLYLKPSTVENEARELARNDKGQLVTTYSAEQRANAVDAVIDGLERGLTVSEMAQEQGISQSTLYSWVVADNRATDSRTMFYARQITKAIDMIETAPNPLELARGRELARAWHQTAAVRAPREFAPQQQQINVNAQGPVSIQVVSFANDAAQQAGDNAQEVRTIDVKP